MHRSRDHAESECRPVVPGLPRICDPDIDLPSRIYSVPDKLWGFSHARSDQHPGLCVAVSERESTSTWLQGTDAEHIGPRAAAVFEQPSVHNGLFKDTAFKLAPRRMRLRRALLLHPERYRGQVSVERLTDIRARLREVFDPEAGH